jgi:hypothetical protein
MTTPASFMITRRFVWVGVRVLIAAVVIGLAS